MTKLQKRILWAVAMFSIVFNFCCLCLCWYSDRQLEKQGIEISKLLEQ